MAFTVTTRTSQATLPATDHTVTLPDGSNVSGVRVVVLFGAPTSAITWPAGWTGFFDGSTTDTRLGVAYRDIDGTEGFDGTDDTITVTTGEIVLSNAHAYLISAGHDAATAPEAATAATGIGANADAPSLDPSGWATEETLWIAVAGYRFGASFSAAPTDYTDLLSLGGGDSNTPLGSARLVLSAASEDPGAFTSSDGANWVATTVAVRPSAAVEVSVEAQPGTAHPAGQLASLAMEHVLDAQPANAAPSGQPASLTLDHRLDARPGAAHPAGQPASLTMDHQLDAQPGIAHPAGQVATFTIGMLEVGLDAQPGAAFPAGQYASFDGLIAAGATRPLQPLATPRELQPDGTERPIRPTAALRMIQPIAGVP